jgi:hypothetical protein
MDFAQTETWRILSDQTGNLYQQLPDTERELMRTWLHQLLVSQMVTLDFTKADGTARTMRCTLQPNQLPVAPIVEGKKTAPADPHSLRVFDVEKQAWRSFRFDRLQSIKFDLGDIDISNNIDISDYKRSITNRADI